MEWHVLKPSRMTASDYTPMKMLGVIADYITMLQPAPMPSVFICLNASLQPQMHPRSSQRYFPSDSVQSQLLIRTILNTRIVGFLIVLVIITRYFCDTSRHSISQNSDRHMLFGPNPQNEN